MWFEQMHTSWQTVLSTHRTMLETLESQLSSQPNLVPAADLVMAAFTHDPANIRVVIVGQDPYPTAGVAVGRAFAIAGGKVPASLRNILKELDSDLGVDFGDTGPALDLAGWQSQGVFLLNRHLTALAGQAGAHFGVGWEDFTDAAVRSLVESRRPLVLVLWGRQAAAIKASLGGLTTAANLTVIEGVHPSPLSAHRGFFGSKPFSAINAALIDQGLQPIDWKA